MCLEEVTKCGQWFCWYHVFGRSFHIPVALHDIDRNQLCSLNSSDKDPHPRLVKKIFYSCRYFPSNLTDFSLTNADVEVELEGFSVVHCACVEVRWYPLVNPLAILLHFFDFIHHVLLRFVTCHSPTNLRSCYGNQWPSVYPMFYNDYRVGSSLKPVFVYVGYFPIVIVPGAFKRSFCNEQY